LARPGLTRYSDVAIGLHWLIAILIISLVAVGKFMTGLESDDPLRFTLTQWHKSFGITVLLLSVIRLLWRFGNSPPPHPRGRPPSQRKASGVVHGLLYLCLFLVPITGWMLVSVSPLNIDTLLFDVIPWPHLEPFASFTNKSVLVENYTDYHELAGNLLLLLMIGHILAALKHQFINRDGILKRISSLRGFTYVVGLCVAIGASVAVANWTLSSNANTTLQAGASKVTFEALVAGDNTVGVFGTTTVTANLDSNAPEQSSIVAIVQTAGASSDNAQVQSSLPGSEWFDVEAYPEARFESTNITVSETGNFNVSGILSIKATSSSVSFPMTVIDENGQRYATGKFAIDRREFDIGMQSQTTEEYVGFQVTIEFRFELSQGSA